jgi:hypothetical protein
MNSLDALAATAKKGAGIVRRPSWRAAADLAPATWCGSSPNTSRRQYHCT